MAESEKWRGVGEVVDVLRERRIGGMAMTVYPGADPELIVPVPVADLEEAGVSSQPGTIFSALVNMNGTTAAELRPESFQLLPPADPDL